MRVLFVTQEMDPYTELSKISEHFKKLPQTTQEGGCEIRVLMPKFGGINERRHRLHEVVRLSGMNIIVDDEDYPLIIKVASVPGSRLQVYFLDNEEFFKRKNFFAEDDGTAFPDNIERSVFFCKGVMETVKKFGWAPDIIHCHGTMTALVPLFVKKVYHNDPIFSSSKVLTTLYTDYLSKTLDQRFWDIAAINELSKKDLSMYGEEATIDLNVGSMMLSDAILSGQEEFNEVVEEFATKHEKPFMSFQDDPTHLKNIVAFYKKLTEE